MTDAWGSLHIDVVDDEIIVTLPFTIYTVTYYKPPNSPQLLAKNFPSKDDPRVPLTQAEFLARAWRVATDKARELGGSRVKFLSRWLCCSGVTFALKSVTTRSSLPYRAQATGRSITSLPINLG